MTAEQKITSFESDGFRIVDQQGAHTYEPLKGMQMHYFEADLSGFNTFEPGACLRRHVHRSKDTTKLVAENITILNHPILLEVNDQRYFVEPGTQVRIDAGVPHSWGTMELGTRLPNGGICEGTPLMMFRYDEPVEGFTLCKETETFKAAGDVPVFTGDKDELSFPKLTQEQVLQLPFIRNGGKLKWDGKPYVIPDDQRLPIFRPGKVIKPEENFDTAMIGFGNVGPTIALSYALKGLNVRAYDIRPEAFGEAMQTIDAALGVLVKNRQVTEEEAKAAKGRITNMGELTHDALAGTKFIVEAIDEKLEPKQALFKTLAEIAPADAILATNTSSLNLDEIARDVPADQKGRCVGVHVTLPAYFSPAVEVVKSVNTNDETMQVVERLVKHLDRQSLHIQPRKDGTLSPGLFWNRLQTQVALTCMQAIEDGSVKPEEVHLGLTGALAPRWLVVPFLDTLKLAGQGVVQQYTGVVASDPVYPADEQARQKALIAKYFAPGSMLFPSADASASFEQKLAKRVARDEMLLPVFQAQAMAWKGRTPSTVGQPDASALSQHAPERAVS